MSHASSAPIDPAKAAEGASALLETCLERTVEAFRTASLASEEEIGRVRLRHAEARRDEKPRDLIEILAKVQGTDEEHMASETARLSHLVAGVIAPSPPLIPFAGKLIAPSAFYEAYTNLHELARELLSPVIYAEDTDAIGTGSLNPVAANIMAGEILEVVNRRFAIRPFVTAVRLDYESASFLSRKHFGL